MVVVDGQGVPIGADLDSAWPSEIKLLEPTIEKIAVPRKRLIAVVQLDDGFSLMLEFHRCRCEEVFPRWQGRKGSGVPGMSTL